MTRVAVLANRGDVGGGEIMQVNLALALRDLGHEVLVVAPATPHDLADLAGSHALPVATIPGATRAAYARGLRRWYRRQDDVLVWCNGLLPGVATAFARRPARGARRVVHLHQVPRGRVQRVLSSLCRRGAALVVVPSEHVRAELRGAADVLPNWTSGLLTARAPVPAPAEGPGLRIGFLGRIARGKGVDVLGEACALLPPELRGRVELVVAGDDRFVPPEDRTVIDRALASAGVPVSRPGWQDASAFFSAVDLAVVPSTWPETFGLVVAEAMEARCPVVVSDAGALPEVVGPGYPWVAAHGDPQDLARVLTAASAELPAAERTAGLRARWEATYSPAAGRRNLARLLDSRGLA